MSVGLVVIDGLCQRRTYMIKEYNSRNPYTHLGKCVVCRKNKQIANDNSRCMPCDGIELITE